MQIKTKAESKYSKSNFKNKNFENEVFKYKAEIESLNEKIESEKIRWLILKKN